MGLERFRSRIRRGGGLLWAALSLCPAACNRAAEASAAASAASLVPPSRPAPDDGLSPAARLGKKIFFDESLSASGAMSCATCHDPDHAYGPPNDRAVQLGGPDGRAPGTRAVPSLRYKEYTPAWADLLDNPDGVSAPGPGGGFAWDGRADTLADQARLPLLSPVEMANASPADVVAKLARAAYAPLFASAFPGVSWSDVDRAFGSALRALEAFQREDRSFHPYTSKFDRRADNKLGGTFTPAEERGFKVFVDTKRGNCASCHYHGAGLGGSSGVFTDYSYEAIGVPRNAALAANADPAAFDLGVCGPLRADHAPPGAGKDELCGRFKTPTLRNVATRRSFFHNGVMSSLEQAVRFYATRDTMPELWYPTVGGRPKARNDRSFPKYGLVKTQVVGGKVRKYDDLPERYAANVDPQMPLDGRARGATPPLGERDVQDLICFLETLTDGYEPPASPPTSGRCVD
ncbi:MAG TPA: cytochrome c peroxidase [Polyangia bacterium]|nr:cytochrome c peroxidase [Polyangia bacterium]